MNIDIWIPVIAAVLSALVTAFVTRLDDILDLLNRSTRRIDGDWEGCTYLNPSDIHNTWDETTTTPDIKYILRLSQRGRKVKGTWTITDASAKYSGRIQKITGEIINEYLLYEMRSISPEHFRVSTTLLCMDSSGQEMDGFFVANADSKAPFSVCAGYTKMIKKV